MNTETGEIISEELLKQLTKITLIIISIVCICGDRQMKTLKHLILV